MVDSVDQDAVLMRRATKGDADAFGALYLRHLDAIYRYVYFRVGEVRDAEDLTEQVFLKAWQALPNYRDCGTPFSNWLYRIAHNIVVDYYRRCPPVAQVPAGTTDLESIQLPALEQVLAAEEVAGLAAAILQLPDDKQRMIILRFVEGLTHAQIARILDITEGASRTLQHRSLADLARILTVSQEREHV
jgi:RNA polymerase sigma-70 factor, ECF subfamily